MRALLSFLAASCALLAAASAGAGPSAEASCQKGASPEACATPSSSMLQRASTRGRSLPGSLVEEGAKAKEGEDVQVEAVEHAKEKAEVKTDTEAQDHAKSQTEVKAAEHAKAKAEVETDAEAKDHAESEAEATEDLEEVEIRGARVEVHQGARLIVHEGSEVALKGVGNWIITVPGKCTTADLTKNTERMPQSVLKYRGHPSAGGLCFLVLRGTEKQIKEELESHLWPSRPICETDKEFGIIPDVEDTAGGKSGDLRQIDSSEGNSTATIRPISPSTGIIDRHLTFGQPNPPSWGLDRIDDRSGLDNDYTPPLSGRRGAGVHVYVVDTGIRTTHDDFGGRAIPTLETVDGTCVVCSASDTSCANDVHGHGTHCAGTVGGTEYGVAKRATIHAVKMLGDDGRGMWSWFIEAIDWIMSNGQTPAVLSASLGGSGTSSSVNTAVTDAVNSGVTVVVAAGNEDIDACGYTPAHVPAAITVGATRSNDERAGYSSWGSCLDIYAPGSSIVSCGRSSDAATATMSGTSMATPHVAGAAALLLAADGSLTPRSVLSYMRSRATLNKITDAKEDEGSPNRLLYVGTDRHIRVVESPTLHRPFHR